MSPSNQPPTSIENPNIAANQAAIYEGGNLITISIRELVGNEIALRQLINNLNLTVRNLELSQEEIQQLKIERSSQTLQPALASILAVVNAVGVFLTGLGTNYWSSDKPPPSAGWILAAGILLSLLASVSTILFPILASRLSKR